MPPPNMESSRTIVERYLNTEIGNLREVNRKIFSNPELAYKEYIAHDALASFLEGKGFEVRRKAYGLETCFEALFGHGDKEVVFCAEYDALPEIGHACGHNLIATSSLGAFIAAAHTMSTLGLAGRLRILGTPAEEDGGGKVDLIKAGAFNPVEDVAAAIMAHPMPAHAVAGPNSKVSGIAGLKLIALNDMQVEFRGKSAHAGGEPWNGTNALDAGVHAYNGVSMMRQQMRPEDRMHGVFKAGGTVPNVIPDYTRMHWLTRSPSSARADDLMQRVKNCCTSGALATSCEVSFIEAASYQNLRVNTTLCQAYVEEMAAFNEEILPLQTKTFNASTDMGNVSYLVPSFHGAISIKTSEGVVIHSREFASAAGTDEAHVAAVTCAKGMAMLAIRVLLDNAVQSGAMVDFGKYEDL